MSSQGEEMRRGVAYGVAAGALWGTVFLGPRLLPEFSPLYLSAGRYIMYGAVSLLAAAPMARRLATRLTAQDLRALLVLALAGNLVYYVLLAAAVQLVGIAPASLIIGILPVTITLAGSREHGALPLARLIWPLVVVLAGILCVNVEVFSAPGTGSWQARLLGVACAAGSLCLWTWFAVANARFLQRHQRFTGNEWSVLWGIVTGLLGVLLWPLAMLAASWAAPALPAAGMAAPGGLATALSELFAAPPHTLWWQFWGVNLVLAVGASWLGNGLWNAAARRLPLTLSGQLIVFETLFALLYGFVLAQRMPRPLETLAIVLLTGGVCWSVRTHADERRNPSPRNTGGGTGGI
jgi:drug/metabolite transporter (DMT)-like permease